MEPNLNRAVKSLNVLIVQFDVDRIHIVVIYFRLFPLRDLLEQLLLHRQTLLLVLFLSPPLVAVQPFPPLLFLFEHLRRLLFQFHQLGLLPVHLQHLELLHVQRFLFPCSQSLQLDLVILLCPFEGVLQQFVFLFGCDFGPVTFVILALVLHSFVSYFSQPIALVPFVGENIVHKIIVLRSDTGGLASSDALQAELIHVGFESDSILTFVFSYCFRTSSLYN